MRIYPILLASTVLGASLTGCGGSSSSSTDDSDDHERPGAELVGTWESNCYTNRNGSNDNITRFVIDAETIAQTIDIYASNNGTCSGETGALSLLYRYDVGDSLITDSGVTAREIDIEFLEERVGRFVGPDVSYSIYHIDGSGMLYFSHAESESPENRPSSLNFDTRYSRQ